MALPARFGILKRYSEDTEFIGGQGSDLIALAIISALVFAFGPFRCFGDPAEADR
jgi:hypothetical protein